MSGKNVRRFSLVFSILFLALLYDTVNAQEMGRKGVILGGGLGGGVNHIDDFSNFRSDQLTSLTTNATLLTEFRIGYAPSNTLEIYYFGKGSWWRKDDVTILLGLTGLGVTKYLVQSGNGVFLKGGLGFALFDTPFDDPFNSSDGFGLFGGLGYKLSRHWSIETDVFFAYINGSGGDLVIAGFKITLNFLIRP